MKYHYAGLQPVAFYGVGIVEPDSDFETDQPITHPEVELVKEERSKRQK